MMRFIHIITIRDHIIIIRSQIVMTAIIAAYAVMLTPKRPGEKAILQARTGGGVHACTLMREGEFMLAQYGLLVADPEPSSCLPLQVWLQEFAWTEDDLPNKKEERSSSLPSGSDVEQLNREPMWCFETAIKLMYWSFLCYDYEENKTEAAYSVDTALSLYDLHSFEMLWEESMVSGKRGGGCVQATNTLSRHACE